eukprot:scaffold177799_cov30-Tisochrysis_lutea.AAC.4
MSPPSSSHYNAHSANLPRHYKRSGRPFSLLSCMLASNKRGPQGVIELGRRRSLSPALATRETSLNFNVRHPSFEC